VIGVGLSAADALPAMDKKAPRSTSGNAAVSEEVMSWNPAKGCAYPSGRGTSKLRRPFDLVRTVRN
jgi:hypothetical protein